MGLPKKVQKRTLLGILESRVFDLSVTSSLSFKMVERIVFTMAWKDVDQSLSSDLKFPCRRNNLWGRHR